MKLKNARLCVECEEIFDITRMGIAICPSCANSATMLISKIFENINNYIEKNKEGKNGNNQIQ